MDPKNLSAPYLSDLFAKPWKLKLHDYTSLKVEGGDALSFYNNQCRF